MSFFKQKKVLVTPLDWGLGHATRSIPVIRELQLQGSEVQIASSGDALKILKLEFPQVKFHQLISYSPVYSNSISFTAKIILQLPKFIFCIWKEHKQIEKIIEDENIDLIISDNRYGCWSKKVESIFITHQVNIILNSPWKICSGIVNYLNHNQIRKFDQCWVPDSSGGITGVLTDSKKIPVRFIGMLSRFVRKRKELEYDVLAIISGPEPHRQMLEDQLRVQLQNSGLKYFLVKGKPDCADENILNEKVHVSSDALNELIEASSVVICRSGYSSIMDLMRLEKKVIFIPTPGQTEQEYLAKELEQRGLAFFQTQNSFNLQEAIEKSKRYSGLINSKEEPNLLRNAITELLEK